MQQVAGPIGPPGQPGLNGAAGPSGADGEPVSRDFYVMFFSRYMPFTDC